MSTPLIVIGFIAASPLLLLGALAKTVCFLTYLGWDFAEVCIRVGAHKIKEAME